MKAASMIENSPEDTTSVVFLTDARSVLEALTNNTSSKLAKLMTRLSNNLNIAPQHSTPVDTCPLWSVRKRGG
ncbi:hypothetical protein DPMN_086128 [Dreissena polymorpha]|uniref:Uncharacterized protein n=1 Tax=Dreissena polymorpha TaxID=45954 RepID=A0A9D3YDV5_DREPO|nr:hypothetical protein DPMN_086128 [Dreissena polymorpha]